MRLTIRNHYNPCFWTAYWNPDYYRQALAGVHKLEARSQKLFVLGVKPNKVYERTAENVHYDKQAGLAEFTAEAAKDYCKRHFPEEYASFCEAMKDRRDESYVLDFENIWTTIEQSEAYQTLLSVISKQRIDTREEKAFLAWFICIHAQRSHSIMTAMLQAMMQSGFEKFEFLVRLKHTLADPNFMLHLVAPIADARWTLYTADADALPLCDSPILHGRRGIMVALSPRLLLDIDMDFHAGDYPGSVLPVTEKKLSEFQRRTIGNTFREIIFSDRAVLESWRQTPAFQERRQLVISLKGWYNAVVRSTPFGDLWKLNAFGTQP